MYCILTSAWNNATSLHSSKSHQRSIERAAKKIKSSFKKHISHSQQQIIKPIGDQQSQASTLFEYIRRFQQTRKKKFQRHLLFLPRRSKELTAKCERNTKLASFWNNFGACNKSRQKLANTPGISTKQFERPHCKVCILLCTVRLNHGQCLDRRKYIRELL